MLYVLKNSEVFMGKTPTPRLLDLMRATMEKELADMFGLEVLDHLETTVMQNPTLPTVVECFANPKTRMGEAVLFRLKSLDN